MRSLNLTSDFGFVEMEVPVGFANIVDISRSKIKNGLWLVILLLKNPMVNLLDLLDHIRRIRILDLLRPRIMLHLDCNPDLSLVESPIRIAIRKLWKCPASVTILQNKRYQCDDVFIIFEKHNRST